MKGAEEACVDGSQHDDADGGPSSPGRVTVDNQEELVTAKVVERMLSRWSNDAVAADVCDRSLYSEFAGDGNPIGDTITVPRRDRHRVQTGTTFSAQAHQSNFTTLSVGPVKRIDEKVNMFTTPLYRSAKQERKREDDKMSRMIAQVETEIMSEMSGASGYWRFVQPLKVTTSPAATTLVAAGFESTSHPNVKGLTQAENDLAKRGINSDELCALLDPDAKEGLGLAAVAAPYENPIGRDTYQRGLAPNPTRRVNFDWKQTSLGGSYTFPTVTGNLEVNAAPAEGSNTIVLKANAGFVIPVGTRFTIGGVKGVNEETSDPVTGDAQWVVTAVASGAGSTRQVTVDRPFNSVSAGDPGRRRTCSALPKANDDVFIGGIDFTGTEAKQAASGKSVSQSFLIVRDTTMLVFVDPELPTRDVEDAMIRNKEYAIAFAAINYFDGDEVEWKTRILMRPGYKTVEPEAGGILGGNAVN